MLTLKLVMYPVPNLLFLHDDVLHDNIDNILHDTSEDETGVAIPGPSTGVVKHPASWDSIGTKRGTVGIVDESSLGSSKRSI